MTGRGRRCKQRLDDVEKKRRYWNLREEALGHPLLRTYLRREQGAVPCDVMNLEPVTRQTM